MESFCLDPGFTSVRARLVGGEIFEKARECPVDPADFMRVRNEEFALTTRNQYMVFLMSWGASITAEFILALWLGFDVTRNFRGTLFGFGLVAIIPASAVHLSLIKTKNLYTRWQVSRGKDVLQDRDYEDCDGYLHITPIADAQKQQEIALSELVSGVQQIENDLTESRN